MEGLPPDVVTTAALYTAFADREVAYHSPSYTAICHGIAADSEVLRRIAVLPADKQQPNLLLGAVRWLGGPVSSYADFRAYVLAQWTDIVPQLLARRTQTNEAGRCGPLLPVLASIAQESGRPLALIEVGASAGLCLYPDRYQYRYGDRPIVGPPSPVSLTIATSGPVPVPAAVPKVVWRAGVDLNPLDVTDEADMRWLECLVWPEQTDRRDRLRAAISVARTEPPYLVRGDLNERVAELVASAPADACAVVFHTSVLAYVDPGGRDRFAAQMAALPARWVSNEAPPVFPSIAELAPPPPEAERLMCVVAVDGVPVAYANPHGQLLHWL